ncbi:MAG: acyltransferase family protein [Acidimicrobiia bacterium]
MSNTSRRGRRLEGRIGALDGLRGLALAAVMVFHADPTWLPGGFVGPDLFFALSGYLIAKLSADGVRRRGSFSVGEFWKRRMSRLLPAATVVVGFWAWVAPLSSSLAQMLTWRVDVVASVTGWMNWKQVTSGSGYFAANSIPSPLLHYWTYAIELQFYLLWPLLFWVLMRALNRSPGRAVEQQLMIVRRWCIGLAATSFLAQIILGNLVGIGRAYYGTDTRLGALLLGASLGLIPPQSVATELMPVARLRARRAFTVAAAALWVVIMVFVHHDQMLLVRGAMVVETCIAVLFVRTALVDPALSAPMRFLPLRWLGKVSYSVYLWHFPIWFVWLTPARTGLAVFPLFVVRFGVACIVGGASYWAIERQAWRVVLWRWTAISSTGITAAVLALFFAAIPVPDAALKDLNRSSGTQSFQNTHKLTAKERAAIAKERAAVRGSSKPQPKLNVFLMGDSQAFVFGFANGHLFEATGDYLGGEPILGCGLWTGYEQSRRGKWILEAPVKECTEYPTRWKTLLSEHPYNLAVLYPSVWDMFDKRLNGVWVRFGTPAWDEAWQQQMQTALNIFQGTKIKLVIMTMPYIQSDWTNLCPSCDFTESHTENINHLNEQVRILATRIGASVIDLNKEIAPNGSFTQSYKGVSPMFADGTHLSTEGSQSLVPWLREQLAAVLEAKSPIIAPG